MDTNKLKELAELASKATPGPWWIDSHGHCMVSESQDHRTVFLTNDGMGPATRHPETGNLSHWPNDWDASYIASADPTTILELIAEVERLRADTSSMRGSLNAYSKSVKKLVKDGTRAAKERDRLKAENEALRKDAERYRGIRSVANSQGWDNERFDKRTDDEVARNAALEGGGR